MKSLNKPEVVLPLTILVMYVLCLSVSPHFFSFVYTYFSYNFVLYMAGYKVPLFITATTLVTFFGTRLYQKKILTIQDQYYNFFDSNPMPMTIVDPGTQKFLAVNKAAVNIYGYSKDQFLSLSVSDIRIDEEKEPVHQDLNSIHHGVRKAEIRHHRKKNGEIIMVEVSASEVVFKNKKCRLLLAVNVTEILKAREEKRISEEEHARQQSFISYVVENFPVDVAVFDKDHRYILLNKTAVKNDEMRKWMIGKDDFDYFNRKGSDMMIAQKRRERFLKAIDGESKEWIDEHIVDGKLIYMLRKFYPYYEAGELKYVYGYGMDITELKNAQSQRDEYIMQLEKIAFDTSHKIRQPICNLQGLISLFETEQLESQELRDVISCMQHSITAMDEFTRDLGVKLHEYRQNLSKQSGNYDDKVPGQL